MRPWGARGGEGHPGTPGALTEHVTELVFKCAEGHRLLEAIGPALKELTTWRGYGGTPEVLAGIRKMSREQQRLAVRSYS